MHPKLYAQYLPDGLLSSDGTGFPEGSHGQLEPTYTATHMQGLQDRLLSSGSTGLWEAPLSLPDPPPQYTTGWLHSWRIEHRRVCAGNRELSSTQAAACWLPGWRISCHQSEGEEGQMHHIALHPTTLGSTDGAPVATGSYAIIWIPRVQWQWGMAAHSHPLPTKADCTAVSEAATSFTAIASCVAWPSHPDQSVVDVCHGLQWSVMVSEITITTLHFISSHPLRRWCNSGS